MEILVPFLKGFTSSRLFATMSLILARKVAREWSLGGQPGNKWNLCEMEHVFNPMENSSEIFGIFGKWKTLRITPTNSLSVLKSYHCVPRLLLDLFLGQRLFPFNCIAFLYCFSFAEVRFSLTNLNILYINESHGFW